METFNSSHVYEDFNHLKSILKNKDYYPEAMFQGIMDAVIEMKKCFKQLLQQDVEKEDVSFVKYLVNEDLLMDDRMRILSLEYFTRCGTDLISWDLLFNDNMMAYLKQKLKSQDIEGIKTVERFIAANKYIKIVKQFITVRQLQYWYPALVLPEEISKVTAEKYYEEKIIKD